MLNTQLIPSLMNCMKAFLIQLICLLPLITYAQSYEVLVAKKVIRMNGTKVRKGDYLLASDSIQIKEKGELMLNIESAMHLRLPAGYYFVGKESTRLNNWYDTHLTLTQFLKRKNLILCKFKYKTLAVPGSDLHYEIDRIEVDQKGIAIIKEDTSTLKLKWHNPEYKYKGSYYIIVRDFYNHGFIDIIETDEDSITLYPTKYGHKHMYYTVLAENCRASLRYKIDVRSAETYTYGETNFLQPDN